MAEAAAAGVDGTVPRLQDVRDFFFDLDGTLADSASGLSGSIKVAFQAVGRRMPVADVSPYIGPGIRVILANMDPALTAEQIDSMERAFRADYDAEGVLRTEMFADVAKVLGALRDAGARLFVVTNKPKLATARLLEKHGLTGMFTAVVSRNSREPAYQSKGEMLRDTMRAYRAEATTSVMVGDTAEDGEAAREAGVLFAHATYGYGTCGEAQVTLGCFGDLLGHCVRRGNEWTERHAHSLKCAGLEQDDEV